MQHLTFDVSKDQFSDTCGMGSCLLRIDGASWDFGVVLGLTSVLQFPVGHEEAGGSIPRRGRKSFGHQAPVSTHMSL